MTYPVVYVRLMDGVLPDDRGMVLLKRLRAVGAVTGVTVKPRAPSRVRRDTMQLFLGRRPPKRLLRGVYMVALAGDVQDNLRSINCDVLQAMAHVGAGLLGLEEHYAKIVERMAASPVDLPQREERGRSGSSRSGYYRRDS